MHRIPPKRLAKRLAALLRRQQADALYVKKVFRYVREELDLVGRSRATHRLPELLTEEELARFYEAVWQGGDRTHPVMIKLLLVTGIRNAELANLTLADVDLTGLTLRIQQGKGQKDRDVPFPASFRGELAQYRKNQKARRARYLFETNRQDKFTTRWIRELLKSYARKAGIEKRIYPHLFRHQLLTHLARKGLIDAKLQVISGHQARENLALYQKLSLADVAGDYQAAMKDFPVP
jgi:integrase/recombinase XerD